MAIPVTSHFTTTLHPSHQVVNKEIFQKPGDTLRLGIPALLYFIQNYCLQLASANLPAALFQVTYQGKTLVVAFCSVVLLQKRLKRYAAKRGTRWMRGMRGTRGTRGKRGRERERRGRQGMNS